jgi:hypothetical protein
MRVRPEAAIQGSRAISAATRRSSSRAGRVDDARAVGHAQPAPWLRPRPRERCALDDALAGGWSTRRCWSVDDLCSARRRRSLAPTGSTSRARTRTRLALRSHRNARAWDEGLYDEQIVLVPDTDVTRDESMRPDTSMEGLATAARVPQGRRGSRPATSSPLNDGAGAVLMAAREAARRSSGSASPRADRVARRPRRRPRRVRHQPCPRRQTLRCGVPGIAGAT